MKAVEFLSRLGNLSSPFIQTREVASIFGISTHSVGKYLKDLRDQRFVEKIRKGKWVLRSSNFDPLQVAEFITAPQESYLSLQTALYYHGMIEQIPAQTYSVTIDRSKTIRTPIGTFSFHHCNPDFFTGYKYIKPFLKVAIAEKALVDYFYFAPTKSRQFARLPELEIPKNFSWKKVFLFCDVIPSLRTRSLVLKKIKRIVGELKVY